MNDNVDKSKLRIHDIMNEVAKLKKYNSELMANCSGEKLENYLQKLNSSIVQAQNKIEEINDEALK